MPKPQ